MRISLAVAFLSVIGCGTKHLRVETGGTGPAPFYPPIEAGAESIPSEASPSAEDELGPSAELAAGDVLGCQALFEMPARGKWHEVSGERYFVDEFGRPSGATTRLPPIVVDSARDTGCQGDVGRWGDVEEPGTDFDGGHLIAYQLGGWSGRANLVPQAASFNRGNWAQIENALADCGNLLAGELTMEVFVEYPDPVTLVPSAMGMTLHDRGRGLTLHLRFANESKGGPDGTSQRALAVAWLRAVGCERGRQ